MTLLLLGQKYEMQYFPATAPLQSKALNLVRALKGRSKVRKAAAHCGMHQTTLRRLKSQSKSHNDDWIVAVP